MWNWNLEWRRTWFEWEIPMVEVFYNTIQQTGPKGSLNDGWVWKGKKSLEYTV